jgi:hypothetical protein
VHYFAFVSGIGLPGSTASNNRRHIEQKYSYEVATWLFYRRGSPVVFPVVFPAI